MSKITCPHCGYVQEAYPNVILCSNCYADIKGTVDRHFKTESEERIDTPWQSARPGEKIFFTANGLGSRFLRQIWSTARGGAVREGRGPSSFSAVFRRAFETSFKRFWILFPLMYISISFLMLVSVFLYNIGLQIQFPEDFPADPSMMPVVAGGVAVCLFVFFYAQAAFIFGVSNPGITLSDVLTTAWRRFGSYIGLMALMFASVAIVAVFVIPAVVVGILFSFAPFILAREDAGIIAALSRSFRYVTNSWLQVALRLTPVAIVVICTLYFIACAAAPLLMAAKNTIASAFIIAALLSVPVVIATVFAFTVYDDLRTAASHSLTPETVSPSSPEEAVEDPAPPSTGRMIAGPSLSRETGPSPSSEDTVAEPAPPAGLRSFSEHMNGAWVEYKRRFVPLTTLYLISYLPLVTLLLVIVLLSLEMSKNLNQGISGVGHQWELYFLPILLSLWFSSLAAWKLFAGLILLILGFFFARMLHFLLELAFVYAVVEESTGAWGAIGRAFKRLKGFVWTQVYLYWLLIVPGAGIKYMFAPYIFALQRDEETPASSISKSRKLVIGLWGTMYKEVFFLRLVPVVLVVILFGLIIAGIPAYAILRELLFNFTGYSIPSGVFPGSGPYFLLVLYGLFLIFGGFYLPFQKVFLYVLYKEIKDVKGSQGDQPA